MTYVSFKEKKVTNNFIVINCYIIKFNNRNEIYKCALIIVVHCKKIKLIRSTNIVLKQTNELASEQNNQFTQLVNLIEIRIIIIII